MIKIGITGGIGSGKTTVCKIFEVLGIPIYYADDRAKELLESDKNVIKKVKNILVMMYTTSRVNWTDTVLQQSYLISPKY
jgi:broad-specificity NMP kinase